MDINKIRSDFPVVEKAVYLNHASIGPSPRPVLDELSKYIVHHKAYGDYYMPPLDRMFDQLDDYRETIGKRLLSARNPSEEIAFTYNTSYGLAALVESMEWSEGDHIILNDLEYTSNSYTYQSLAKKRGLVIDVVNNKNGRLLIEDYEELLSNKTRLVAISHVQFSNGFKTDLKPLTALIHEYGAQIIVDGIQSLGAVPLNVHDTDIDYLSSGGYKWLLGPLNSGFIYIKEELTESLEPVFIGSMSDINAMNLIHHQYQHAPGAKRFQASLSPNPAILATAVNYLTDIGIENIYRHILSLIDIIIERAEEDVNLTITTPLEDNHRSGIIYISCPKALEIFKKLRKENICVSYRLGAIRVSPHVYNTPEEITLFIDKLQEIVKQ